MKAKQMFRKLGYEQTEMEFHLFYKLGKNTEEYYKDDIIEFDLRKKTYRVQSGWDKFTMPIDEVNLDITLELHNAIHQQMKELGWI